ncbi:SIMPL domain-containing protein [Coralliovum pocilloporae]|uniref:SIMPL domain-containing protein n=1 Tax=Coralliovum pocilloporae TaxID=3066369 RepID=UPI003307858F
MKSLLSSFVVVCALLTPASISHAEEQNPAYLTITATGTVKAEPDMAVLTTGVQTRGKTAKEALRENSAAMEKALATITAAGVERKNIQTSNFSIQPQYIYPRDSNGQSKPPKLVGYIVSNQVTVTVKDLDKVGSLLDAVISAGANNAGNLSFSIAEPDPLQNEARRKAVQKARERAELYAETAGVRLGHILSISEGHIRPPHTPHFKAEVAALRAADSVPVAAGEQSLNATVTITWQLEQ